MLLQAFESIIKLKIVLKLFKMDLQNLLLWKELIKEK